MDENVVSSLTINGDKRDIADAHAYMGESEKCQP